MSDFLKLKQQELLLEEKRLEIESELPHLYGWKFYKWARAFFESTNKENILVSANQISKSSTQIRKAIHWATEPSLWPRLWQRQPLQFWYLYPTYQISTIEFKKKWVPEFLPRGSMKEHAQYGWSTETKSSAITALHFNTGVSIYFKTYAMDAQDLQAGSVDSLFLDEEPAAELLPELQMRLVARQGYFHAVFTPTLGQEVWRRAFEERGKPLETFKEAFKQQVSMFDCLYYEDGSKSPWTLEAIQRAMNACKSEAQVQRRIYGRFISDEGLKYPSFERAKNIVSAKPVPKDWDIYVGADVGGGGDNHPSAVVFVAVNQTRTKGAIFKGWRGDGVVTTASDVVDMVIMLSKGLNVSRIFYDYSSIDFYNIATSMGLNVERAEKSHGIGEQVLNVLFKNKMLDMHDIPELDSLAVELTTLKIATLKRSASDDFTDALRYAVTKIDWDWSCLTHKVPEVTVKPKTEVDERRDFVSSEELDIGAFQDEVTAWNELLQSGETDGW